MRALLYFALTAAALGQPAEQSAIATATVTVTPALDEAGFEVSLTMPVTTSVEQAVALLADLGIRQQHLYSASTSGSPSFISVPILSAPPSMAFRFRFSLPAARFRDTLERLDAFSRRPPDGASAFQYQAVLAPSAQAFDVAQRAVLGGLIQQTRGRAGMAGRAAGFEPGPVLSISAFPRVLPSFLSIGSFQPMQVSVTARFGAAPGPRFIATGCTREVTAAADSATMRVTLQAPASAARAEVLEAAGRFGLDAATLTDVTWSIPGFGVQPAIFPPLAVAPDMVYHFERSLPVGQLRAALDRVLEMQRTRPAPIRNVSFSLGLHASDAAFDQAVTAGAPALVAACRAGAEAIASAAGVRIGGVLSVSSQSQPVAGVILPAGRVSDPLPVYSVLQLPISLNAVFRLE